MSSLDPHSTPPPAYAGDASHDDDRDPAAPGGGPPTIACTRCGMRGSLIISRKVGGSLRPAYAYLCPGCAIDALSVIDPLRKILVQFSDRSVLNAEGAQADSRSPQAAVAHAC